MELVSGMGKSRNRVWFGALLTVLVLALAAYPVLQAHWPEFVEPTFSYQGGMLSTGIWYYIAFVAASLVIRLVFLAYAFPAEDYEEKCEVGYVSASVLDPGTARWLKLPPIKRPGHTGSTSKRQTRNWHCDSDWPCGG